MLLNLSGTASRIARFPESRAWNRQKFHSEKQKHESNRSRIAENRFSASPKPHPSKPHPCSMPQAKMEVALQFSECCAAETALQHRLFCSAEVIWTRSCAAANEKMHCNIEKAALQESGAFLPLSCGFQAPTFRHPRLGPAEIQNRHPNRILSMLTATLPVIGIA